MWDSEHSNLFIRKRYTENVGQVRKVFKFYEKDVVIHWTLQSQWIYNLLSKQVPADLTGVQDIHWPTMDIQKHDFFSFFHT